LSSEDQSFTRGIGGRRHRRARRAAIAIATCAAAASLYAPGAAPAATESALQSQISSAQSRATGLASDLEAKHAELVSAQGQAAAAAAREAQLSGLLEQGQQRAAALAADVDRTQAHLDVAKRQLARARRVLARRLVDIYKSGSPDTVDVILSSDGFDDLVTRTQYLKAVENSDTAMATRVRQLRNVVARRLDAYRAAKARADAYNRRIAAARSQVSAARARAEATASALAAARSQEAATLSSLQSQMSSWQSQLEQLRIQAQQESQQQAAAQSQQQVGQWLHGFAIPESIVMCESGGNPNAVNPSSGAGGLYQILPSTWSMYGGQGSPQSAPKSEQDRIASQIWADSGPSAWECAG
jgi:peptidoglycan hydrolase CwlO-like protein